MDSQNKKMSKDEPSSSGGTLDPKAFDKDNLDDILNIPDIPLENLEGDLLVENWDSKLGPIPADIFVEPLSLLPQIGNGSASDSSADFPQDQPVPPTSKTSPIEPESIPNEENSIETSTSGSSSISVPFGAIPVRSRSRQSRTANNSWALQPPMPVVSVETENSDGFKKCSHCEVTETPQWREGPFGPKTLCNACGVRFRSGRLYPEYRPAGSPTFLPSHHSNSHKEVMEIRKKTDDEPHK